MITKLKLSYPPTANHIWRSGGGRVYRSAEYVAWMKTAMAEATEQKPKRIAGHYNIKITAYRPDKRKRDIDNLIKPISDFLERAKIIDGDHMAENISAGWAKEDGKGIEVEITKGD